MIAKTFLTILFSAALLSCTGQNTATNTIATPIHIQRFDKELFDFINSGDTMQQQELKQTYLQMLDVLGKGILNLQTPDDPNFFPKLLSFYSEPTLKELYKDAITQYDTVSDIEEGLTEGFAYLQTNFPTMQIPAVYMHISGLNQNVLVGDSLLSISIDKYMGKDYPLYQDFFYNFQLQKMQRSNIVPDYLAGWLMSEYPFVGKDNVLLDRMIYEGKIKYLLSQALPNLAPEDLLGYTEQNLEWCQKHEESIWKAMIERKHLYTPDHITTSMYFEDSPSTYLTNEAPGNLGSWIGWQIINKYMKETGSTPEALMQNNDAQSILEASKYKP
ncbi:DUF2268 domain-containing putative Zn-dependent protease [Parabacteroides bouchesdurhonensis]|uniref:gliding motility lipoprotein GldB n=1 Tax=Parabacteroides bouchesdurhonensis TaxID=1936995 RepID=UPI000E52E15F|nr:DUF2268 domain-containing putative Zn-dependent protease [Parabacteroides bouchesdurhonensis]RHJ95441.1 gliding motility protein GldB [Bacteroides sp. AM07-16]